MRYYILTNKSDIYIEKDIEYHYKDGSNEFPISNISPLWFIPEYQLTVFHKYISSAYWIRLVTIPDNAIIKLIGGKNYATLLILDEKIQFDPAEMCKYINFNDSTIAISAVQENGLALQWMNNNITKEIAIEAVKQNGHALKYIIEQTIDICLIAVKKNGLALQYVNHQNSDICLSAVRENGLAIQYVKEQTNHICLTAINSKIDAFPFIINPTEKMCTIAVEKEPTMLRYVQNQTFSLCMLAVKSYGLALRWVHEKYKTSELCTVAINQNPLAENLIF